MIRLDDRVSPLGRRCLGYGLGEFTVSVSSDLDDVLEDLDDLYHGYPRCGVGGDRLIRMEVRRLGGRRLRRARYLILGDGEEIGGERRRGEILPFLEWGVNWRVIVTASAYLQIHAAAIAYQGCGCVLAGSSGCGKSTLAAALTSRGWQYLCDELALIEPETLEVHPFPKALCIKVGGFEAIRRMNLSFAGGEHHVKGSKGRVAYINPLEVGPDTIGGPSPIRFVALLRYAPGMAPRVRRIPHAQAAFGLARHALNRDAHRDRTISILSDLVRNAECYIVESGPIEETCDLLEQVISQGG